MIDYSGFIKRLILPFPWMYSSRYELYMGSFLVDILKSRYALVSFARATSSFYQQIPRALNVSRKNHEAILEFL
jgi:hypothetical protein